MMNWKSLLKLLMTRSCRPWLRKIAHIGTHNAYHVGQIIFVRKLQGRESREGREVDIAALGRTRDHSPADQQWPNRRF